MRIAERPRTWAALLLALAVSATLALLFWQATRDDASPFFVTRRRQSGLSIRWRPATVRPKGELEAIFTRRFVLERAPERAQLTLRIYREGASRSTAGPCPSPRSTARAGRASAKATSPRCSGSARTASRCGSAPARAARALARARGRGLPARERRGLDRFADGRRGGRRSPRSHARSTTGRAPRRPGRLAAENPRPLDALRSRAAEIRLLFAARRAAALAVSFGLRRRGLTALSRRACWPRRLAGRERCALARLFVHNHGLHGHGASTRARTAPTSRSCCRRDACRSRTRAGRRISRPSTTCSRPAG